MLLLWILTILLFLALLMLAVLLVRAHRQLAQYEASSRALTPAYVDAVLALTDAQRAVRDVLALVPVDKEQAEASARELDEAVTTAIGVTRPVAAGLPQFAPVYPLHARSHS